MFCVAAYSSVFTLPPVVTCNGRAHHGEILREAPRMAEAGKLTPRVDPRHFTLDTVLDACDAFKNRTATGKLVVDIGE